MSRDSISESRFGNRTGHTCIKSRNKPSGRFQEAVSSNVGWKNEAAIAPAFGSWCRDRPSRNVPLGLLVIALVWIGPILACGSFQPRPTPTRQLPAAVSSSNTPTPEQPAPTTVPTAAPTPTATVAPPPAPTLVVQNPLTIGEQAAHCHSRRPLTFASSHQLVPPDPHFTCPRKANPGLGGPERVRGICLVEGRRQSGQRRLGSRRTGRPSVDFPPGRRPATHRPLPHNR